MRASLKKALIASILNQPGMVDMSLKQIESMVGHSQQRRNVLQKWILSNCTNFGVYSDPDYQWDLVDCFLTVSHNSVANVLKFLEETVPNYKSLSYFDDWNGNGLTTLQMVDEGCQDVTFFNDVQFQADTCVNEAIKYNLPIPHHLGNRDILAERQYDVVFALQSIEHTQTPLKYIDEVDAIVKRGGYLCISMDGLSNKQFTPNVSIGHFWEYYDKDNKTYTRTQMAKVCKKYIESLGYEFQYKPGTKHPVCWNKNPFVFKKL